MTDRLEVIKTYKLYVDGKFPRSESGRTIALDSGAHVCQASRKDLRDAVVAARKAFPGWKGATAYLRGQILYRMAEMLEARDDEFRELMKEGKPATKAKLKKQDEVSVAVDRLVSYAGWADKFQQVLGSNNPVAGPYYNFTLPEPTGVIAVLSPDEPALLSLVSLIAPAICAGNTVVAVGGTGNKPSAMLVAAVFAEVCATSDIPGGVVNLLTGHHSELAPVIATHRDIDGVHAAGLAPELAKVLREGVAENLKRVTLCNDVDWYDDSCQSARWIERVVEMKTIWHPSAT